MISASLTSRIWTIAGFILALFVFVKNAWVTEDAFILFRSIEQLFDGNGPRWNPHERVQVYTSPLWYWILAVSRLFSSFLFYNVLVLSFLFFSATLFLIRKLVKEGLTFFLLVLLMCSTEGFYSYTSSGLENPLAFFLISAFVLFADSSKTDARSSIIKFYLVNLCFGLLLITRHDLSLLLFPALFYLWYSQYHKFKRLEILKASTLMLCPLFVNSLFSTLYYGFPFPNTAYAKLNTEVPVAWSYIQGLRYIYASWKFDSILIITVLISVLSLLLHKRSKIGMAYAIGILLNLIYIVKIGGDFMQGRFLSFAFLLSILTIPSYLIPNKRLIQLSALSLLILYQIFYPNTPLKNGQEYKNKYYYAGILDERWYYFQRFGLFNSLKINSKIHPSQKDKRIDYKRLLLSEVEAGTDPVITGNIGYVGYMLGEKRIVVDFLGLSDPLIARLPANLENLRPGHFSRNLPEGYLQSIRTETNHITDASLAKYYSILNAVVSHPNLLHRKRLLAIWRLNTGKYDYLLDEYSQRHPPIPSKKPIHSWEYNLNPK